MDDFKEIPLFSNYLISKDGRLYDKSRDRILAICKDYPVKQPKGLIMTNVVTGEETFFTSTKKASVELGLKSSTIWQMSGKKTLWRKKYLFSIFNIHEEIRSAFSEMEK